MPERLISALGVIALLAFAVLCCPAALRRSIRLRSVAGGMLLLFALGSLVLRAPLQALFAFGNDVVDGMLGFSQTGAALVFGPFVDTTRFGFVLAFQVLPSVVFFAAFFTTSA